MNNQSKLIEIDGSIGYGQVVRTAVALHAHLRDVYPSSPRPLQPELLYVGPPRRRADFEVLKALAFPIQFDFFIYAAMQLALWRPSSKN